MQMYLPIRVGREFDPKTEWWIGTGEPKWVGTSAPTPSYIEFKGSRIGGVSNQNKFVHIIGIHASARCGSPSALHREFLQPKITNYTNI